MHLLQSFVNSVIVVLSCAHVHFVGCFLVPRACGFGPIRSIRSGLGSVRLSVLLSFVDVAEPELGFQGSCAGTWGYGHRARNSTHTPSRSLHIRTGIGAVEPQTFVCPSACASFCRHRRWIQGFRELGACRDCLSS